MASRSAARLASTTAVALVSAVLTLAVPAAAQSGQVTICEATGSPSNPYVFTTIDPSTLPEHLARGDYQASSLADCTASKPAAATPAPQAPQAARPVQASTPAPSTSAQNVPISNAAVSQAATSAPSPAATRAQAATPEVARSSSTGSVEVAGAQSTPEPQVTALPRSGGEPDRVPIVLGLLGLCGAGLAIRRLARAVG